MVSGNARTSRAQSHGRVRNRLGDCGNAHLYPEAPRSPAFMTIPGSDDLVPRALGLRAADQGPIRQRVSDGQPRELNGHGLAPHETRHRRNNLVATADGKAVFENAGEDTGQFIDVVCRYSLFALGHEYVVQGFVYR